MFGHSWMLFHVYQFYQIVCPAFIVMTCLGMRYYSSYFTMIIWCSGALTTGCVNLPPPHPHTWVQASQADPCPAPQHTWDFIAAFLTFIGPCQGLAWPLQDVSGVNNQTVIFSRHVIPRNSPDWTFPLCSYYHLANLSALPWRTDPSPAPSAPACSRRGPPPCPSPHCQPAVCCWT